MNKKLIGLLVCMLMMISSMGAMSVNVSVEDNDPSMYKTSRDPPNEPSEPDPTDGATDVSTKTKLSWRCTDPENDKLYFDIHFGTLLPPPLVKENYWDNNGEWHSYDPGCLSPYTEYYWKIVAKDENGETTEGPIWEFTTWPPTPDITSDFAGNYHVFKWETFQGWKETFEFKIRNDGDPGSKLDWRIVPVDGWPWWGFWEIEPMSGEDLEPSYDWVTIYVTVRIFKTGHYYESFHVENIDNPSDYVYVAFDIKVDPLSREKNRPLANLLIDPLCGFQLLKKILEEIK